LMKIPKVQSFARLVLGYFLLLSSMYMVLIFYVHFGIVHNIVSHNIKEKHDMLVYFKNSIIEEEQKNPQFDLNAYITQENRLFNRLKLDFVTRDRIEIRSADHKKIMRVALPDRDGRTAVAIKINLKQTSGYLVLYSAELNRINAGARNLTIFILATVLPSLLVGFFIFRRVYRRSSHLVGAVERISRGDYHTRVGLSGNDEYTLIGQAFNDMAASIEKSTEKLKAIDEQRRKFIADISHELATPLTSIQGFVETLQMQELKLSIAEQQGYLKIVWEETERLSYLVKDLLELARIDAGTMTLMRDRIICEQFLLEFAKRNSLRLKEKQVELQWIVEPGLWIYADYRRLEQIFQNLLDNALKHSEQLHQVTVTFSETPEYSRVSFTDDGSGIPSQHLERVFDSFYKVVKRPEQSSSFNSNGLGLSIVKRLVELHGGTIQVESQLGVGTTFVLIFPKTNPEDHFAERN
jgi:signal transduction histidine kinase